MTTMLFYERLMPLSSETHRGLRLKANTGDYTFAAAINSVPLAGVEFQEAARDYPIIFTGTGADTLAVALLGLHNGRNLYLGDDGGWLRNAHVPAFVRRYPFALARDGESEDFTVCIDDSHGGFDTESGEALFDEQGEQTDFLRQCISFLTEYQGHLDRTKAFAARLDELGLLQSRELQVAGPQGQSFVLRDLRVVDERKLAELDDATVLELYRSGTLSWIYAHLVSTGNVGPLVARAEPWR
ncbi:MAG: SapC family protein [Gammaproteobacteria bacterium]